MTRLARRRSWWRVSSRHAAHSLLAPPRAGHLNGALPLPRAAAPTAPAVSPTAKQQHHHLRPSIEPGVAFQRATPAPARAHDPLRGSVAEFFSPPGADLLVRTAPL